MRLTHKNTNAMVAMKSQNGFACAAKFHFAMNMLGTLPNSAKTLVCANPAQTIGTLTIFNFPLFTQYHFLL
jgi:hypothetical protein